MRIPRTQLVAALFVMGAAVAARGQFTEVDISSQLNANIQTYSNGSNYQLGGTQLTVAGVPFALDLLNGQVGTTGVVQTPSNGQTNSYTFAVPPGTEATDLFTLINTAFGTAGTVEGSVVVTGTKGETATLTLIEGDNVRDHNNDGFVNTLSDPTVVPTYFVNGVPNPDSGQVRLDRQDLVLPPSFAGDTIASMTAIGIDNGNPGGEAFLAAATLAVVPEPGAAGLVAVGAVVLLGGRRIRRAARN